MSPEGRVVEKIEASVPGSCLDEPGLQVDADIEASSFIVAPGGVEPT